MLMRGGIARGAGKFPHTRGVAHVVGDDEGRIQRLEIENLRSNCCVLRVSKKIIVKHGVYEREREGQPPNKTQKKHESK